jgi:phospholipid/cholesterol/gamma-HCH transport system substrate-binding protein
VRRPAGVVVALAAAALLLGGCAFSLQSLPKVGGAGAGTYALNAVFTDVLNLPDDAQVRVGAQVVGEVSGIVAADFQADLTLAIDDGVKVPVGTTAQVRFDNPLGDEYVLLQEPVVTASAPAAYLAAGATIPVADTSTAPSVEDTFGALSLVLNGGGLNQLQVIIHELNATFAGNQPQIRSFLSTIDRAVSTVAGGRVPVDDALDAIDRLSHQLSAGRQTIGRALAALAPAVGILAGENAQISSLLGELSNLGAVGTGVARQSGQDTVDDVRDLLPLVQQLESVSQQIGPDLQDLARFEAETPKVAPGAYLQVSVIADVMLPSGAYEPTAVSSSTSAPQTGAQAVTALLEGGLS